MALLAVHLTFANSAKNPRLAKHLEIVKAHKMSNGFFVVDLDSTAVRLRHDLCQFLEDGDQIVVVEFVGKPSFSRARVGTKDWIADHCELAGEQQPVT